MRVIDSKWVDLATGYRILLSMQNRLEAEFGRAIQVSLQQQYNKDLNDWIKRRRVFFALIVLAPLSLVGLCLAAYYYREVSCVIAYWVMLVLVIGVTLAIAGRSYIRNVMNRPTLGMSPHFSADLEERWWSNLAPARGKPQKGENDLLQMLSILPDDILAIQDATVGDIPAVYLFAPSGPWLFTARDWSGEIVKQDGVWKQLKPRGEPLVLVDPPDQEWFILKEKLAKILSEHFPQTAGKIHGGVVFTNPKAEISKDLVRGNVAPLGSPNAWVERITTATPLDGLTLDMQLKTLDALLAEQRASETPATAASARELAVRLYTQMAGEIRQYVTRRVRKGAG